MSVLVETAQGRMVYCKGALETVLATCEHVQLDVGIVPLDAAARTRLLAAQDAMAVVGLRVLAFAHGVADSSLPTEERGLTLADWSVWKIPPARSAGSHCTLWHGGYPRDYGDGRSSAHGAAMPAKLVC